MTTKPDYDAVIAGSGPAGSATAIALARAGRRILLVEKRRTPRARCGETIAPAAKIHVENLLGPMNHRDLPAWALPYRGNVSVWGGAEPAMHDFFCNPYGPGLCVDRTGFDAALLDLACNLGVEVRTESAISAAQWNGHAWNLSLVKVSSTVSCGYLVDATGRTAALSKLLGITRRRDDPLFSFALRFSSELDTDRDGYTRIEASPYGWWYSNRLPATEGTAALRTVVLHVDQKSTIAGLAASTEGFANLLAETTLMHETLSSHGYAPEGRVQGAPAGNAISLSATGDGFIAVGDAAQAYDPLSSQGLERALISGQQAGQAVHYALSNPDATQPYLDRYEQQLDIHWTDFLRQHAYYYTMEPRWTDQPFWSRRRFEMPFPQPNSARDAQ